MASFRTWVALCCVATTGACVTIPRPDAGPEAGGEAAVDGGPAMDGGDGATLDATPSMDAMVTDTVEPDATPSMDASTDTGADVGADVSADTSADTGPLCGAGQAFCGGACVDVTTSAAHCGRCGNACGGAMICEGGACQCPSGRVSCGGACVDVTASAAHCGRCDNACPAGVGCNMGECRCAPGSMMCGGACVDTQSNTMNCGACGTVCPAGATCSAGVCRCATPGAIACGGLCVNPLVSAAHCGRCDNACASPTSCISGACACAGGGTVCGGACVNTATSPSHCGACNNACAGSETCNAGVCQCRAGLMRCGAACVDTASDPMNCGACGVTCGGGRVCSSGMCRCPFPQQDCGGARCLDLSSDVNNCGACGVVCTPPANAVSTCASGCGFTCRVGFDNCDANDANGCETDVSSSAANCGACGTMSASGTCTGGVAQEWVRALRDPTASSLYSRGIAADGDGNLYVVGSFSGALGVGGGRTLSSMNVSGYLASYTSAGVLRWVRQIDATGDDYVHGVAVRGRGASTRVAIVGNNVNPLDFGAGLVTIPGSGRGYVAVYDGAGSVQWATMFSSDGGFSANNTRGVAIGPSNEVAVATGFYANLVGSGWSTSSPVTGGNMALVTFAANGMHRWTRTFTTTAGNQQYVRACAFDAGGNVYLTAMGSGVVSDGGGAIGTAGSSADIFLASYSAANARNWASMYPAAGTQDPLTIWVDEAIGNVSIGGEFSGTVNFGTSSITAAGSSDGFVAQFSVTGANRWSRAIGWNNAADQVTGLAANGAGELFALGRLHGTITFGTSMLSTGFNPLMYVAAMNNSTGAALRAFGLNGGGGQYPAGLAVCGAGYLCFNGIYGASASVRSAALPTVMSGYNALVARIAQTL